MKALLVSILVLCVLGPFAYADSETIIGVVNADGTAELTADHEMLRYALEEEWGDGTRVKTIALEKYDRWYLVAHGNDGKSHRLIGIPLNEDSAGRLRIADGGIVRKCIGEPCGICTFTVDKAGMPSGCECSQGGMYRIEHGSDGSGAYLGSVVP